jgi:hypothetical protein
MTWLMLSMEGEKKQDNKLTILYWERLCVRAMAGCRDAGKMAELAGVAGKPAVTTSPATVWQRARGRRPWSIDHSIIQHSVLNVSIG